MQTRIPCVLMRGGTSKGPFFLSADLPEDPDLRDEVLLRVMGSPDMRQIDGLGGAEPLTSKVAIVSRSTREGADVVIYDSTYTDEEFPSFTDWGHSTWQEGVRLCDAAGVGTLVIFHHDPSHDDAFMDRIAVEAEQARPGTVVAREGLVLTP